MSLPVSVWELPPGFRLETLITVTFSKWQNVLYKRTFPKVTIYEIKLSEIKLNWRSLSSMVASFWYLSKEHLVLTIQLIISASKLFIFRKNDNNRVWISRLWSQTRCVIPITSSIKASIKPFKFRKSESLKQVYFSNIKIWLCDFFTANPLHITIQ